MPIRFEYSAQVINGNFFDVARAMNDDLSFQGWDLVAIETVNQFHCVAMLKRPVIIEPFLNITEVPNG